MSWSSEIRLNILFRSSNQDNIFSDIVTKAEFDKDLPDPPHVEYYYKTPDDELREEALKLIEELTEEALKSISDTLTKEGIRKVHTSKSAIVVLKDVNFAKIVEKKRINNIVDLLSEVNTMLNRVDRKPIKRNSLTDILTQERPFLPPIYSM
jgi:CRISPR/Cas system CSM-associated protein Csm4 (group 5 of RAMP superfamily)